MRRHPRRKQQSPAGLPCGSYSGAGTEKRPVACRGLLAVARSAKRPRRDKGYSIPAETQGPEGGTRPLAPRHLWRNGPLAFSGPPCNGFGPSAAAVKCVHRRDVRQPARTRRKGGHHVADPGRSTGVDLGVDAGKAQVGGHHVRPTGRAGGFTSCGCSAAWRSCGCNSSPPRRSGLGLAAGRTRAAAKGTSQRRWTAGHGEMTPG